MSEVSVAFDDGQSLTCFHSVTSSDRERNLKTSTVKKTNDITSSRLVMLS